MEISQRMSVALSLSFVGGVIPRRADLEFDDSDDAGREQHNVQPLPKAKQRHFNQNVPVLSRCAGLRESGSKEFDLAFPRADLLRLGGCVKCDVSARKLTNDRLWVRADKLRESR